MNIFEAEAEAGFVEAGFAEAKIAPFASPSNEYRHRKEAPQPLSSFLSERELHVQSLQSAGSKEQYFKPKYHNPTSADWSRKLRLVTDEDLIMRTFNKPCIFLAL